MIKEKNKLKLWMVIWLTTSTILSIFVYSFTTNLIVLLTWWLVTFLALCNLLLFLERKYSQLPND